MSYYLKRFVLIIILVILSVPFFGAEKSDFNNIKSDISFDFQNNSIKTLKYDDNDFNDLKKLYMYNGFQGSLYRAGLYMLGFGATCGILGGVLFGLSYLIEWYLANSIGWVYEKVVLNIFVLESVYSISSYYTTIAIAFWISGIVLMALSVIIIPGIILMVVDKASNVKRIMPLKEAVGFAIKF